MVKNCSGSSHIQPRQIYDLTDLSEKIWLLGGFKIIALRTATTSTSVVETHSDPS